MDEMKKRQREAMESRYAQVLSRARIRKPAVAKILDEWFNGSEDERDPADRNHWYSIYTYEAEGVVLTAVLSRGTLYFLRIFQIGDKWEISQDETFRLVAMKELSDVTEVI